MTWLFSYGSNHPDQLQERLGHRVSSMRAAYKPNYRRIFRGWSRNWGGGVASLERSPGSTVYGYIAKVSDDDLAVLDRFEGVRSGNYARKRMQVVDGNGKKVNAVVYLSTSREFNRPTRAYLEAVALTIGRFWHDGDRAVSWRDIRVNPGKKGGYRDRMYGEEPGADVPGRHRLHRIPPRKGNATFYVWPSDGGGVSSTWVFDPPEFVPWSIFGGCGGGHSPLGTMNAKRRARAEYCVEYARGRGYNASLAWNQVPPEEARENPNLIGKDLVYRVVMKDDWYDDELGKRTGGHYYIEGLPLSDLYPDDEFMLMSYSEWGEPDTPNSKEKMHSALYDAWQVSDALPRELKNSGAERIVFITPFGRFATDSFHVVEI